MGSEWAHRVSLDTADLREANEKAAAIWADWLTKFDEQRKSLNTQRADSISSELAKVLAQRVRTSRSSTWMLDIGPNGRKWWTLCPSQPMTALWLQCCLR